MTTEETLSPVVTAEAPKNERHLEKSTVAVLGNTVATGALGTAFWLLAGRLFEPSTVGAVIAASSLLIALSFVAQLNLATAFSRYLPAAGSDQRHIVQSCYRLALGGAMIAGGITMTIGLLRGGSIVDGGDLSLTIITALSIPVWVVFALQDGALVAVRKAHWLPLENGITTLAKLALLPLLLLVPGESGILIAWTLPAVPAILYINRRLFGELLEDGTTDPVPIRPMVQYATSDLAGAMATMLSLRLVPLIVVEVIGGDDAAYVAVPWSILTVAALALTAISRLMLSEMSHEPERAAKVARRTTKLVMMIFVPGALIGAPLAYPLLRLASPQYASQGVWVLMFGILGLIPAALAECRMARMRYAGKMVQVTKKQIIRAASLLIGVVAVLIADRPELIGVVFLVVSLATLLYIRPEPIPTHIDLTDQADRLSRLQISPSPVTPWPAPVMGSEALPIDDGVPGKIYLIVRRWALLFVGALLAAVGMARADYLDIDGLGLFSALPPAYFVGVATVLVGLVRAIYRFDHRAAWAHIIAAITFLHGMPGFVEPHPRFAVAWLHAGFTDQIAESGELLPFVDARFSWPGFFSTAALLQRMAGTDTVLWVVRFSPILINLFAVVAVWNLAKVLKADGRQANLAAAIFVVTNWIGQDYFAPQAIGFLIALVMTIVLLKCFPANPVDRKFWNRILKPVPVTDEGLTGRPATLVYLGVVATMAALVITHQLSPVLLGLALTLLGMFGRIKPRLLGPILLAGVGSWLAFGAEAYWLGHLDKLTGSVGDVSSVVQANVSERAETSSPERQLLLRVRLAMMGSVWLVSGIVLIARRIRRTLDPAFVALFFGPFIMVAAQPYGGELLLRVALLTLPICSIIIATTLLKRGRNISQAFVALGFVLIVPVFLLARFGNESYELITPNDLAVTQALYEVAPDDSVVYVQNRQTLVSIDRVAEVRYRSLSRRDSVDDVVQRLRLDATPQRRVYVLLTETQTAEGMESRGLPEDWILEFADGLLEYKGVVELDRQGGAVLLEVTDVVELEVDTDGVGQLAADQ